MFAGSLSTQRIDVVGILCRVNSFRRNGVFARCGLFLGPIWDSCVPGMDRPLALTFCYRNPITFELDYPRAFGPFARLSERPTIRLALLFFLNGTDSGL